MIGVVTRTTFATTAAAAISTSTAPAFVHPLHSSFLIFRPNCKKQRNTATVVITTQTWVSVCCSSSSRRMFAIRRIIDFSISLKSAGQKTFPSPTSNTLPRSKAQNVFQRRLPSSARGWTPLHFAAKNGHAATVERLLAAGADIDAVDNDRLGLGAGRVEPDSTQISRNLASEH